MNPETTLTLLDLSRIYNRNRCIFCTWHTRYGMPYTSFDGNVARISIKDLLAFFDTRIRTSNTPKCRIDNKNTLLTYLKNQNTTPTMNSIVNSSPRRSSAGAETGQSSIVNTLIQLDPGATIPTRAHETDVGYDVKALRTVAVCHNGDEYPFNTPDEINLIYLSRRSIQYLKIDTGIHITPPAGFYFELVPNSRLAKTPFHYGNSIGVIDPDYTGSIKVILRNTGSDFYVFAHADKVLPGNVVGQLILRPMLTTTFQQVDHLTPTDRADGGFGSTATPQS